MSNLKSLFTKKSALFILIFSVLGLIALQIPLLQVVGSKTKFTLFDSFGPVASGFIGTIPGIIAVFLMQAANLLLHGFSASNTAGIIRLFPMVFAAIYFGKKTKLNVFIPLLAILAWNLTPAGRAAWFYSMFWLIPVACYFLQKRFLLARSLGATFTAHAVGGALWIYFFPLPKAVWISLIPITTMERTIFALGIAGTYLVINNILAVLDDKKIINTPTLINKNLVWKKILNNPLS